MFVCVCVTNMRKGRLENEACLLVYVDVRFLIILRCVSGNFGLISQMDARCQRVCAGGLATPLGIAIWGAKCDRNVCYVRYWLGDVLI